MEQVKLAGEYDPRRTVWKGVKGALYYGAGVVMLLLSQDPVFVQAVQDAALGLLPENVAKLVGPFLGAVVAYGVEHVRNRRKAKRLLAGR